MEPLFRIHANAKVILRWLLIVVPIAVTVGSVVALFLWLLDLGTVTRGNHPWLLYLVPVAGLVIVFIYRVAGKTGTAEIPTPLGYTSNATNASFVGWGPVDDPQFLVYVWLEKPLTSPWGSIVAAPVFSQAVEKLVVLLDLPPDDVRLQLNAE